MEAIEQGLVYRKVSNDKGRLVGESVADGSRLRLTVTEKIWELLLGHSYFYRLDDRIGAVEATVTGGFSPVGEPQALMAGQN